MSTPQPDPGDVWSRFTADPRRPDVAALRASDRDRAVVAQELGDAYADGRLDREEYDERAERAAIAKHLGDIQVLIADLVLSAASTSDALALASPVVLQARAADAWKREFREAIYGLLMAGAVTTGIWFAVSIVRGDDSYFWPIWVLLLAGINVVRTWIRRDDIIANKREKLERRQRKEIERDRRREVGGSEG